MPITSLHLILTSKIYVVNSDMKNVIGMSDPNVMFKVTEFRNYYKYFFNNASNKVVGYILHKRYVG